MNQPTLWREDAPNAPTSEPLGFDAPASPTLEPAERTRLSTQNATILARLQQGPATRRELTAIALNVTARISELRQAGHTINVVSRDDRTGLTVYQIDGGR